MSVKLWCKPLPPLRSLPEKKEREEEEEVEMEMKELVASTEEDKDDYYFEDSSNIGNYIPQLSSCVDGELCHVQ